MLYLVFKLSKICTTVTTSNEGLMATNIHEKSTAI